MLLVEHCFGACCGVNSKTPEELYIGFSGRSNAAVSDTPFIFELSVFYMRERHKMVRVPVLPKIKESFSFV